MTPKERLHQLIEALPDSEVDAAERFLHYLTYIAGDPLLRAIAEAPYDDEPETEDDRAAVERAREAYARGDVVSDDEVRRELGHDAA